MAPNQSDRSPRPQWALQTMRWSQLTLTELDPERVDLESWVRYFSDIKSDGVCLSAGGYVAYYPTEIPFHYRSRAMGGGDPFGLMVDRCRSIGMAVLARTDPHAIHDEAAKAHPEWVQRDRDGRPRPHWSMDGAWLACMLGSYNFEFMTGVHREIAERYDVQGIFANRWKNTRICYCESCQAAVEKECGVSLQALGDADSLSFRSYMDWQESRYLRLVDTWQAAVAAIRSEVRFIPNSGMSRGSSSPETPELDMSQLMKRVDLLFADYQGRRADEPIWYSGKCGKIYSGVAEGRPVGGIFSVGLETPHRWKDSVQAPAELRTWVAESVANGMRPWWTKFGGTLPDRRWLDPVGDAYRWLADCEPYLRNEESLARVAVVFTQSVSKARIGSAYELDQVGHLDGTYQALLEARLPFDLVHEGQLTPARLRRYDVVVLPNVVSLTDEACAAIRTYVHEGGGVVSTYATSLFKADGCRRPGFGLGDLFGVRPSGDPVVGMKNTYLSVEKAAARSALTELEGTGRIIGGVNWLPTELIDASATVPLRRVPPFPDLPMEEVYPRTEEPGEAAAIFRRVGKGRVVYFPWDIDRTFWEVMQPDHGRILTDAIRWAGGRRPTVEVIGSGLVDVTAWRQQASITVHLVNLNNPMALRGVLRTIEPLPTQTVSVELPADTRPVRARLLRNGSSVPLEVTDQRLSAEVPLRAEHEILAVDLTT